MQILNNGRIRAILIAAAFLCTPWARAQNSRNGQADSVSTRDRSVTSPAEPSGEEAPTGPPRTAPPEAYGPDPLYPPPYVYPPYYPPYYSGYPYGGAAAHSFFRSPLGRFRHGTAFDIARETERWRQDALEARRAVEARRRQRAETGRDNVVERPGPYPYNPAPIDPSETPYGGQGGAYGPPGAYAPGSYGSDYPLYPFDPYSYGARLESYRTEALAAREELTLMAYEDLLTEGLVHFQAGRYGSAAQAFMAAADKHQGDAGSRIHAAQALVAVGLYDEALPYIRRAVSLKPLLLFTTINLQADYGRPNDFAQHVAALAQACRDNPQNGGLWLLLAFEQFFSPLRPQALEALSNVEKFVPYDRLAARLIRAARPVMAQYQR